MKLAAFTAHCPFEIGDQVKNTSGKILIITDIATVHYVKKGSVEFLYEFDNSGKYQKISMDGIKNEKQTGGE